MIQHQCRRMLPVVRTQYSYTYSPAVFIGWFPSFVRLCCFSRFALIEFLSHVEGIRNKFDGKKCYTKDANVLEFRFMYLDFYLIRFNEQLWDKLWKHWNVSNVGYLSIFSDTPEPTHINAHCTCPLLTH